ncbi:LOW QUALITY PROTEIN: uncharacterized protein B0I36DRAFT_378683 [Microdochium trichocladiopsis]|uniref:FAD/NAD(P)-binding domain-containing protein n=1 Tax=Microdochium trichocladiopsis TaxID=1682393 RepID=A0A9P8XQV4_9PEZI|nr:LOW QUALITY PROTEIN: uncharacterized protein B0I36DRAFT_378683 [Microdochium trichocladiopsis]KAH7007933.1 LOW QUALITY PROTEIN: hypothetical protein B0I36DRAFT_378683 [Microdochium trichocladiopsis]
MPKSKIAIICSGWGGFTLAHELSLAKYDVTVISPMRTIQYTPLLASAAAGMINFRLAEEPVRRRNRASGLHYYKATVDDIDFARKTLHCSPSVPDVADNHLSHSHTFTMPYDILILAPGCTVQTFGTPGAVQHAHFLRTTDDARQIQQRLLEMLDAASTPGLTRTQQRDMLRVVVVGGGAIGNEATAELYDLWQHDLRFLYPHLDTSGEGSIEVHDVAPVILGTFDDRLAGYALHKLQSRSVHIETGSHITKVEGGVIYTKEHGEDRPLGYGMLIWATGHDGKIMPDVYALGDCADIEGYALPTLAEVAAEYLARQLNAAEEEELQAPSFVYKQKPNLAYLGQHDGVIGGREEWTGHSAWLAWRSGSIFHWPRSWRRTLMVGISWLFNAVGGRDIPRRW